MNETDTTSVRLTLGEVENLADAALRAAGTSETNARSVARSIAAAEAEDLPSHGLMRLPVYCDHVECGKVDGRVDPVARSSRAGAWRVDARHGFAHPAIDLGFRHLVPAGRETGIAALSVAQSYNCGVLGYHVARRASRARGTRCARVRQFAARDRRVGRVESVLRDQPDRLRRTAQDRRAARDRSIGQRSCAGRSDVPRACRKGDSRRLGARQ